MPPEVAAFDHGDVLPGPLDDQHVFDAGRLFQCRVHIHLQTGRLAAPVAAVGGDDELGLRVVDAVGERIGRETAEDDGVRSADAGAGEHRDWQLGNHRHVDGDAIAAAHAELLQRVGCLVDLLIEIAVGEDPAVARLAFPVVGDLVATAGVDVAIEAVDGDVELATDEPPWRMADPTPGRYPRAGTSRVSRPHPPSSLPGRPRPARRCRDR